MNSPNILLLIAHDLGRHLGCYGVSTVRSPNLNALAADGVKFANAFCVAPQCSPSRAALFTGRYPHQNGVMGLCHSLFAWDLHRDEKHLAAILKGAGYHTALAGVQHETTRPREVGWQQILPMPHGDARPQCDRAADATAAYLREQRGKQEPFYLQVGFFEPHRAPGTPGEFGTMPPDRDKGVFVPPFLVDDEAAQEELAHYQGAIRAMDSAVGKILSALAEDREQNENTVVVFTTDHGIPFPRAKCSVYDPGLQISLLLRWHANGIHAGQTISPTIPNIDILPTLLELAGVPLPTGGPPIMGRSFAPLLTGRPYTPRAELFCGMTYHDYYDPLRAIRTDRWKLIVSFCYNLCLMDPSQEWRPRTITRTPRDPSRVRHDLVELYDLQNDPNETQNLADLPAHAATRTDLLRRLRAFMHETNDPLLKGVPPSPIHQMALDALHNA